MRTVTLKRDDLSELAAEVLAQGSRLQFAARGSSMLPFIREGDLLTVAPLGRGGLRLGEIALYRPADRAVLAHRIIGRGATDGCWLARGDAAWGPVERVRREQVLGRVVALERRGRTRRLDTRWHRWLGLLWHLLWPWNLRAYAFGSRLKRRLLRQAAHSGGATGGSPAGTWRIEPGTYAGLYNALRLEENILTSGQPTEEHLQALARAGCEVVINLATPDSPRALPHEAQLVTARGMQYEALPVDWQAPTRADFERFCALRAKYAGRRMLIHCAANMRVSAFCYLYRVLREGMPPERAAKDLAAIWEPNPTWRAFMDSLLVDALGPDGDQFTRST